MEGSIFYGGDRSDEPDQLALHWPAKSASDSEVKAATIPGKASTRRSEATLGRVIISEVDGFGQTRTAFVV